MRISDWSSDVCSSDLELRRQARVLAATDLSATGRLDPGAGLRFDVDGIAKGYILDRALEKARTAAPAATGIRIDIGGDAVYWGMPDDARGWQVAIADPRQPLDNAPGIRSEEHTSELQSLMRKSYYVTCVQQKKTQR